VARFLTVGAALLSAAACTIQIAGNDRTALVRGVVTANGAPVPNASVTYGTAVLLSTTTDTTGTYRLALKDVPDRFVIKATVKGYLPGYAVVEYRGGVFHYQVDLALQTGTRLNAGSETTLALGGRMFRVKAPAGSAPDGGYLEVAAMLPESGPAAMEPAEAPTQRLQSSGLFFVRGIDALGNAAELRGTAPVTFTIATDLPALTDAEPMKVYSLGEDGLWTGSTAGTELAATKAGYWLAGRSYKTSCVRGVLNAPTKACTGERIRVFGADGILTQDTTGTSGNFCIEGPQGRAIPMLIGSKSQMVSFPPKAASCHLNPDDCTLVSGGVPVLDTDCTASACTRSQVDDPTTSSGCNTK
jgi:hypothetical protein